VLEWSPEPPREVDTAMGRHEERDAMKCWSFAVLALLLALDLGRPALGQTAPPPFKAPDDINFRTATVISEGSRIVAEVYSAKSQGEEPLPTIVMCHGWGGTASVLRPDAIVFARAGFFVVAFDYRGWGGSEGRVVLADPAPEGKRGATFTAQVREIREVVDPIDQTTDLMNVIHWVQGEKQCDRERIGLWGSSYSGGHVVYAAARDNRVKALVSQVPALDSRWVIQTAPMRQRTLREGTDRARGKVGYPAPGAQVVGNLRGAPIFEKLMGYAPIDDVDRAPKCAMLFIVAEKEELFDNRQHGVLAHERAKGPKKLVVIPNITHYGIYNEARPQAQKLAIEWYQEHLKK
jgi:hypothetical protein